MKAKTSANRGARKGAGTVEINFRDPKTRRIVERYYRAQEVAA